MKISKKLVVTGVVASVLLVGSSAFAWSSYTKSILARFAQIKLIVNGNMIKTQAQPFIYNGNVYAPVATIANAIGIKQQWVNNDPKFNTPSVHYDGFSVDKMNDVMKAKYSEEIRNARPIGGQLYLQTNEGNNTTSMSLIDLTTGEIRKTWIIGTQKEGYWPNVNLVNGSVETIDGNPNNIKFMVHELLYKDYEHIETYISTFEYKDGSLTKLKTQQINHAPNLWTAASMMSDPYHSLTIQYLTPKDRKFVGLQGFNINSDGNLEKTDEMFK